MTDVPAWVRAAQASWRYTGDARPSFAVVPRAGQESVWDYPRPPRIAREGREVVVRHGDTELARSRRGLRVLETASPPTVYVPRDDVNVQRLQAVPATSFCEWKGAAQYWSLVGDDKSAEPVAWSYPDPMASFAEIRGAFSFYPARVACHLDGHRVQPQPGRFYGGWVTPELVGPFKGEPGSEAW